MRDSLVFFLNGNLQEVSGRKAFLSLSDYLRREQGLLATKIVCSEGDCGACTVLVGRAVGQRLEYRVVDACICFLFQLDGAHVVSVEGLSEAGELSPVQQAMVDHHGSQCGFCTPGFVASMTGILERHDSPSVEQYRLGLTGNLCRCTGYTSILEAGTKVSRDGYRRLEQRYPGQPILEQLVSLGDEAIEIGAAGNDGPLSLYSPVRLDDALDYLAEHPRATVVAGATDLGVRINKTLKMPPAILDINRITELAEIAEQGDRLRIGARADWTAVEETCRTTIPEFSRILRLFGAPQIRNVGTLGGNIINASPIADSLPLLYVLEAKLEIASRPSTRRVNINDFYYGYKQFDLRPDELLTAVEFALPREEELLRLYKISRRRDLDISTFTAAIRMTLAGERISQVSIAYGAVAPTVLRLRNTEEFLIGRRFCEATMQQAGEVAIAEITPISDVRGSSDFRLQLARNVLLKFYHQSQSEQAILTAP